MLLLFLSLRVDVTALKLNYKLNLHACKNYRVTRMRQKSRLFTLLLFKLNLSFVCCCCYSLNMGNNTIKKWKFRNLLIFAPLFVILLPWCIALGGHPVFFGIAFFGLSLCVTETLFFSQIFFSWECVNLKMLKREFIEFILKGMGR